MSQTNKKKNSAPAEAPVTREEIAEMIATAITKERKRTVKMIVNGLEQYVGSGAAGHLAHYIEHGRFAQPEPRVLPDVWQRGADGKFLKDADGKLIPVSEAR